MIFRAFSRAPLAGNLHLVELSLQTWSDVSMSHTSSEARKVLQRRHGWVIFSTCNKQFLYPEKSNQCRPRLNHLHLTAVIATAVQKEREQLQAPTGEDRREFIGSNYSSFKCVSTLSINYILLGDVTRVQSLLWPTMQLNGKVPIGFKFFCVTYASIAVGVW